jgi:hypothetical protein
LRKKEKLKIHYVVQLCKYYCFKKILLSLFFNYYFHRLFTPFVAVIAVISVISVVAVGLGVGIGVGLKQSSSSSSTSSSSLLPSSGNTNVNATANDVGNASNSPSGRMIGACSDLSSIDSTGFETSVYSKSYVFTKNMSPKTFKTRMLLYFVTFFVSLL